MPGTHFIPFTWLPLLGRRPENLSRPTSLTGPRNLAVLALVLLLAASSSSGQEGAVQSGAVQSGATPAAKELRELVRESEGAVVLLRVLGAAGREAGTGTGFFIDGSTVVTNAHVVEPATRVEAVLADGSVVGVEGVLARDVEADLAILRVGPAEGISLPRGLELAPDGSGETGTEVVVIGNPLGLSGTLSTGVVSAVREEGVDPSGRGAGGKSPRLQITAAISPGSSGSPVMMTDGRVIGVAVSQLVFGQSLNFAVPVAELRRLLAGVDPGRLEQTYGAARAVSPALVRNLFISVLVFFGLVMVLRRLR